MTGSLTGPRPGSVTDTMADARTGQLPDVLGGQLPEALADPAASQVTIPVMRPWLGAQEAVAAAAAVLSGWVAQGPRVAEFEEAFAAAIGTQHAVALSSCTAALHLALIAAGVGPGDEVVVPSLSFIATANAARYVGAQPVFADVEYATQNLTPGTVEPHLSGRTRAVILVDQAGVPADLDGMRALCEPRGITVIEDAACAAGSTYRGRPAGASASLAAYSFQPSKLITTGEGGMLTTSNGAVADRLRRLREHGMDVGAARRQVSRQPLAERYLETGFNFRMTDVQAAIGLVQLRKLGQLVARRRQLAMRYQDLLTDDPGLITMGDPDHGTTNFQSFWVLLPADFTVGRDALLRRLADAGIGARRGIMAAHTEPAYAGHSGAPLPVTERLSASSLILPLYHEMTEADQDLVISVIRAAARAGAPERSAAGAPAPRHRRGTDLMPALIRRAAGADRPGHAEPRGDQGGRPTGPAQRGGQGGRHSGPAPREVPVSRPPGSAPRGDQGGRPTGPAPRGDQGGRPTGPAPRGDQVSRPTGPAPRGDQGGRPLGAAQRGDRGDRPPGSAPRI